MSARTHASPVFSGKQAFLASDLRKGDRARFPVDFGTKMETVTIVSVRSAGLYEYRIDFTRADGSPEHLYSGRDEVWQAA